MLTERSGLGGAARDPIVVPMQPGVDAGNQLWWALPGLVRADDTSLLAGWTWAQAAVEALRRAVDAVDGAPWADRHPVAFSHPLAGAFPAEAGRLNPAGAHVGGDNDTVLANGCYGSTGTRAVYGAVARYVFDVGAWDDSSWVVVTGASGDPDDPHYLDQHARLGGRRDGPHALRLDGDRGHGTTHRAAPRRRLTLPPSRPVRGTTTGVHVSDELWATPATDLARMIQAKEVSPTEILDSVLDRLDAVEPTVHAFITVTDDLAREEAAAATERAHRGERISAMDGIPYSIKDLENTAGIRTTQGTRFFADNVPDTDSVVAGRLRSSGGVLLGKTNTPAFGWKDMADNLVAEPTVNPWDTTRTTGASSGGAAAAVAAGMGPLAQGSDGAGLHPHPRGAVRGRGLQALVRAHPGAPDPRVLGAPHAQRPADPHRGRRRADDVGDGGQRRPRPPLAHQRHGGVRAAAVVRPAAGRPEDPLEPRPRVRRGQRGGGADRRRGGRPCWRSSAARSRRRPRAGRTPAASTGSSTAAASPWASGRSPTGSRTGSRTT